MFSHHQMTTLNWQGACKFRVCKYFLKQLYLTWYCRDRLSSCNIYAVQQDTQSVSMSEFIQHLCQLDMFRTSPVHHQERFLQAVFADLVCGNTRTTQHVQPLRSNGWTCEVVNIGACPTWFFMVVYGEYCPTISIHIIMHVCFSLYDARTSLIS